MAPGDNSVWWRHVTTIQEHTSGSRRFECMHCGVRKTGNADRVRCHLLGIQRGGIVICRKVPPQKMQEYQALAASEAFKKGIASSTLSGIPSISACMSRPPPPVSATGSQTLPKGVASHASTSSNPQPSLASGSRGDSSRGTLKGAWQPGLKAKADAAVARFFYRNAISFHAARTSTYREMVDAIATVGPGYVPPGYDAIRRRLLDAEKVALQGSLQHVRDEWSAFGVSLVADGWSDTRKRGVQGILGYCRGKTFFVKAVDNSEAGKSAASLFALWDAAVQAVGPANVVQMVADGEASNKAAGKLLSGKYPHIYFSPCMAHCLNNLLKDIAKLAWVAPLIEKGKDIVTFLTNHHYLLAIFRKLSSKDLLKYSDTRFAYNFLMLERLYEVRHALRQLVVSEEWRKSPLARSEAALEMYMQVLDDDFWEQVDRYVAVTEPVVAMMRLADGDDPCLGKVYEGCDKMVEKMLEHEMDAGRKEAFRELASSRWQKYYCHLQGAAYMVDPEFQHRRQYRDAEVAAGWDDVLQRWVLDEDKRRLIKEQISSYRRKEGFFGSGDAQADRFLRSSAVWWEDYGASTPELQEVAIKLLSHGCSSSPCERLWSSFGNIASKKRNRLAFEKAADLVEVNAHLRLQERQGGFKAEAYVGWAETREEEDMQSSSSDTGSAEDLE